MRRSFSAILIFVSVAAGQFDSHFIGTWLVEQPYHALYEATLYQFNADGSLEILNRFPAGFQTGSICSSTNGPVCYFGDQWSSRGSDTLVIKTACSDSVQRFVTLTFPTQTNCSNPQIWCGEPLSISVQNDTSWHHYGFQWRWIKCISNQSLCQRPFTSIAPRHDFPHTAQSMPFKTVKTSLYTIDGRIIGKKGASVKNAVIIEVAEDNRGNHHISRKYYK